MPNKHACTVDILKHFILERNAILKRGGKTSKSHLFDKINKI